MRTPGGFDELLGPRRGVTDIAALTHRLVLAEREREDAQHRSEAAERSGQDACDKLLHLHKELDEVCELYEAAKFQARRAINQLDQVRYAAARAGIAVEDADDDEHHGVWTPGRPYLTGEHVLHPDTLECFWVAEGPIAPPAARPGHRRVWVRCRDGHCPSPPPSAVSMRHPVGSGRAVRQTEFWWDSYRLMRPLPEMPRDYLLNVIDWLTQQAPELFLIEWRMAAPLRPCPVTAYPDATAWLADTPLWRALADEKRTRRIRRRSAPISRLSHP